MSELLDDRYLDWLYAMVGLQEENVHHYHLMKQLLSREFVYMPAAVGDGNRAADGMYLRRQFAKSDISIRPDEDWFKIACSILEMMIGLSRHLAFNAEGEVGEWFWHLVNNLGLTRYNDGRWNGRRIDEVIERLVWRQYSYDGNGGLFPLLRPHDDQRYVELWFQMEAYILELS